MRGPVSEYGKRFDRFVKVVQELRSEKGCPWDKEQSPDTLRRYLHEETCEALEAIKQGDRFAIRDELGDILYVIVLLARIFEEENSFDINDVVEAITEKMVRRHPHVFGDERIDTVSELRNRWQEIKNIEKSPGSENKKN
jgi:MazG family protein